MNEPSKLELELDLQIVDLGDAKELTLGIPHVDLAEENQTIPGRYV